MEKLTIWPCKIGDKGIATPDEEEDPYVVMVNPTSFRHDHSITYDTDNSQTGSSAPLGLSAGQPRYQATQPEDLSFEMLLDGTGVISSRTDVDDELTKLKSMLYTYSGNIHQTPVVYLSWGTFSFIGRLKSMGVKFSLFRPTGEPLRARVNLTFTSYLSAAEEARKANKTSPDLTHRVVVKAGDSLPLLCHRIYRNSSYYLQVARINGLTNFRRLEPGTTLSFPPLR